MESWNVFIDTSIFISENYSFKSKLFSSLASLCKSGHVSILLTDITIEEIKANLLKSVNEAEAVIKKASTKARVLRNLDTYRYIFLFEKFDKEKIFNQLKDQLIEFIKSCNIEIIKASEISAKDVFSSYFQGKPPFGEGKKKNEFPDAFVITALVEWCKKNDIEVNVVSEDPDFQNAISEKDNLDYLVSADFLLPIDFQTVV